MKLSPQTAIEIRGLRKDWLARLIGISPSYLSMLLSGERRWTDELKQKFALGIGVREEVICFAPDCTPSVQTENAACTDDTPTPDNGA